MIVINSSTRQFNIPGADLVFGVESDSGSVIKEFQCPRYVGNNLDLTGCFIRMNYRNANGEIDSYLVKNVTVDGDNVVFGWELTPKVTMYKGNISFVMCVVGPDTKVKWHTTLGKGQVLEGLEPDNAIVEEGTADVVAQLIAMVEAQTEAVAAEGSKQIKAVQTAAQSAQSDAVAQIEAKGVNTLASIPEDYTAVQNAVDALARTRGAAIVCSVEGSAITVNDASDMVMQGLRIFGRSTQDGTPTPDAPVEIKSVVEPVVTVCGKNLAYSHVTRETTYSGNTIRVTENKSEVVLSGMATKLHSYGILRTRPLAVGSYTVSVYGLNVTNSSTDRVYVMNAETEKVLCNNIQDGKPKTFTIASEGTVVRLDLVFGEGSTYDNRTVMVQVEKGEVATEYESYKVAQTLELTHTLPGIPVTSGGNYTDSDGQQWICDEVDLERGVYVQRVANRRVLSSDTWSSDESAGRYWINADDFYDVADAVVCTHFVKADGWANHMSTDGTVILYRDASWSYGRLSFKVGNITSLDNWKQFLDNNEVYAIYELATPVETALSENEIAAYRALHSNYPNTTVLNDTGAHMVVKYAADTKLYIDNKIAALVGG